MCYESDSDNESMRPLQHSAFAPWGGGGTPIY